MTYKLMLFLHILAVISLFGAIAVEHATGVKLRRASTYEEVRLLSATFESVTKLFPIAAIVLLATGGYMTHLAWTFATPWVVLGIVLLVVAAVNGGAIAGKRFRAIAADAAKGQGRIPESLAQATHAAALWIPSFAGTGLGLAIVYLMVMKPGWYEGVGAVVAFTVVFAGLGNMVARASAALAGAPTAG